MNKAASFPDSITSGSDPLPSSRMTFPRGLDTSSHSADQHQLTPAHTFQHEVILFLPNWLPLQDPQLPPWPSMLPLILCTLSDTMFFGSFLLSLLPVLPWKPMSSATTSVQGSVLPVHDRGSFQPSPASCFQPGFL